MTPESNPSSSNPDTPAVGAGLNSQPTGTDVPAVRAGLNSRPIAPEGIPSAETHMPDSAQTRPYRPNATTSSRLPVFEILMVYVLLIGAYFRLTPYTEKGDPKLKWGILWGESQWLHPDERFGLFVGGDISPMKDAPVDPNNPDGATKRVWSNLSDYFNTGKSNLNPANKGYTFVVYGTLPIFLTRYIAEVGFNHRVGWNEIASVGRPLSALSDLLVILLVYLAANRLFNKRVGLLAAVFYSWAVLPIQLSHYYKEDTFANFFAFLAIYLAILIATESWRKTGRRKNGSSEQGAVGEPGSYSASVGEAGEEFTTEGRTPYAPTAPGASYGRAVSAPDQIGSYAPDREGQMPSAPTAPVLESIRHFLTQPLFLYSLGFGFALGCAVASKLLAVPVAIMLPVAFAVRMFTLPAEERNSRWGDVALFIVIAACVSLLTFRIFQPYAFKGPGFFNVGISKVWLNGILSQRTQTDFPPAMQWARRPLTFALKNLTVWGLGLPLGLLAWAGFLWAGWRMLKGEWQRHALPWIWTAGYFGFQMWQSHFNPSMRYFLPMYPTLVIFAAWILVWVYDRHVGEGVGAGLQTRPYMAKNSRFSGIFRIIAILVGAFVLVYTLLYAYGFSRLYTRPITRLAASRWIYQNVPGPIVLQFNTADGQYNQPMPVPNNYYISKVTPYDGAFEARQDGSLTKVTLNNLEVLRTSAQPVRLTLTVTGPEDAIVIASITIDASQGGPQNQQDYTLAFDTPPFDTPLAVKKGVMYSVDLTVDDPNVSFSLVGDMVANEGDWDDGIPYPIDGYSFSGTYPTRVASLEQFYTEQGVSPTDVSTLSSPNFNMYWEENNADKYERFIRILDATDYIFITSNRQWGSLTRIPERFPMTTLYYRNLLGCPPREDIVWCYSVAKPGMYQGNLGFELVATFTSNSSVGPFELNDQFAEEAFTVYDHPKVLIFRKTPAYDSQKVSALLGSVDWTKTIHVYPPKAGSYPADLMLPSKRLEEQQQGGTWSDLFNPDAIQNRFQVLGLVLWYVCIFLLGLMTYPLLRLALPGLPDRGYPLARTAGLLLLTWLVWVAGSAGIPFNRLTITIVLLILALAGGILGYFQRHELAEEWRSRRKYFIMIEIIALAFFLFFLFIRLGNPDLWHPWKGGEKPMNFSYFNAILKSTTFPPYDPWFSGGYLNYYYYGFLFVGVLVKWLGIVPAFAYNLILPTLFSMTALGAFSVAWNIYVKWETTKDHEIDQTEEHRLIQRKDTKEEAKGAQEELEVSDWEAEGGSAASSLEGLQSEISPGASPVQGQTSYSPAPSSPSQAAKSMNVFFRRMADWHISMPVKVGLMAGILMVVLGNLGTVGMIVDGLQRLGASGAATAKAPITSRIGWVMQGTLKALHGERLPFPPGDWYWIPSRVIPAQGDTEPITEFPYFTFLYADMHAHNMAMPVAFLALAWAVSIVLGPWGRSKKSENLGISGHVGAGSGPAPTIVGIGLSFFLGALASGALYPINLSDRYTYLALGVVAVAYSTWRFADVDQFARLTGLSKFSARLLLTAGGVILFGGLTVMLYKPYSDWYGQAYGSVDLWKGPRTPIWSYLTHWGLFLFIIVSWMFWETRDWMAHTPLSAARKLEPYLGWIFAAFCGLVLLIAVQQAFVMGILGKVYAKWMHVSIVWLAVPLAAWAGVLILRPRQPEAKRVVLFLIGTGLAITLMVDTVVVRGDIGRMNTVFKFYLQTWALFAVCAAAALGWLWGTIREWLPSWRIPWKIVLAGLVISAGLYTVIAGRDKITDRMTPSAPHTLDGMKFMQYSVYDYKGLADLSRDYRAIRWMQANIQGSPVIVEANTGDNYRWYNRFTIYTGLPSVLGYEWHQIQQRALLPSDYVHQRLTDIINFYLTTEPSEALEFLQKYNVRYIIFGQTEQFAYAGHGLEKFAAEDGRLWRQIYPPAGVDPQNETIIYEVIQP
jgi:YYY domain-containing protein